MLQYEELERALGDVERADILNKIAPKFIKCAWSNSTARDRSGVPFSPFSPFFKTLSLLSLY